MIDAIVNSFDIWTDAQGVKSRTRIKSVDNISLVGIASLRSLILDFAVRGNLLPQNSDEESADVLLKKIEKERQQLVNDGTIKESKSLSEVTENEKMFKLPIGWAWARFGNISLIERGGSPRPIESYLTTDSDGLNWIKIGDTEIGGKYITSTGEKIRKEGLTKTRKVYPGDFLLTNSMSFGRPYITKIEGCIHDGWLRIHPPRSLNKDYLYHLLSSSYVANYFKIAAAGAVVLNLNADKVRELPIPIPPIDEQLRIVAKVDELMALCDELEEEQFNNLKTHQILVKTLLKTLIQAADTNGLQVAWERIAPHFDTLICTEDSIDQLKQTILQLAVIGKLVKQNPNDEPTGELIKKIAKEKENSIKEGKLKKQPSLPEISNDEKPFELPKGWEWTRLGEIGIGSTGKTPSTNILEYFGGDIPFIGPGQITTEGNIIEADKTLTEEGAKYSTVAERGDILMVCIGGTIGKCAIVKYRTAFNQQINCIRPLFFNTHFLYDIMNTPYFQHSILSKATGSATPIINRSKWEEILIPVPSLAEQVRIVQKIEELFILCESLRSNIKKAQELKGGLSKTIVEKAVQ